MAGSSLLALIDDIATLLDDVAVMTKVATKKTAGVLGDDLALNAQQVAGVKPDRELPVVWAVAKGSVVNKAILVPAALAISWFESWLRGQGIDLPIIIVLMMIGGAFLCYEGVEKLAHKFLHSAKEDQEHHKELVKAVADENVDLVAFEKDKIKGAIRTDFILSAEIIVLSLGAAAGKPFSVQVGTLLAIAAIMTVGVYGLVAGIVKLDDLGLYLTQRASSAKQAIGRGILYAAPWLMKFLSVAGTAAMFLVGGGILVHGIGPLHHWVQATMPSIGGWALPAELGINAGVGIVAGCVLVAIWMGVQKLRGSAAH
jgi:predicted DNA repair protein MutK